jgi:hypothetical protein
MELDASMLRPIVGHALDAAVVVPVEWSVVLILAGDGQGLGVFRVSGSARVGGGTLIGLCGLGAAMLDRFRNRLSAS